MFHWLIMINFSKTYELKAAPKSYDGSFMWYKLSWYETIQSFRRDEVYILQKHC